jgi:ribonuclease-3
MTQQVSSLKKLAQQLGYGLDSSLHNLQLALTHKSCSNVNNERLEFLGDAVLNFVVSHHLYTLFPDASEGELTRARALLVKKDTLYQLAQQLQLNTYLRMSSADQRNGYQNGAAVLADALEALFGAILLDLGLEHVTKIIEECLQPYFLTSMADNKDAKTQLQELLQLKNLPLPVYTLLETTGKMHQQSFLVSCHIVLLEQVTLGQGSTRRQAEQLAAKLALEALKNSGNKSR